jgi:alpha-mannosidase
MVHRLATLFVLLCILALPCAGFTADKSTSQDTEMRDLSKGRTLYCVGYAHLDTQWRWSYPQTISEFLYDTLYDNFALFDKYPGYVFNFSGARRYMMMKEYYPEEYERLRAYVESGQWFPCGSSVDECDVNVPSPESLIRHVLLGNRYFEQEFGTSSKEFILPDCFGFPASMPEVLGHCGVRGFSSQKLTWGSAVGIPFNVGVWEGLDGKTNLLAALNPGSYGGEVKEDLSKNPDWLKRIDENGKQSGVYADFHYYGTGDVGGAPTPGSVKMIEQSIHSDGPVKVVSATAEQMFKDIPDAAYKNLPHYKGDLLLTEHSAGSITSEAYMKRWCRKNELLADGAEKASCAAGLLTGLPYPQDKLNHAWVLALGSQMHDILPGTCIPDAYVYSWNDEVLAQNQFADVLETGAAAVAAKLDTQAAGVPVVVYNQLAIEREDLVQATVKFAGDAPESVLVLNAQGQAVPAQVLSKDGDEAQVLFLAKVPSCGFAVFDVQPGSPANGYSLSGQFDPYNEIGAAQTGLAVTENSLENARYRVKLNAAGDVASVFDKEQNRELLAEPIRLAFTHDSPGYWPAWNIDWDDQSKAPYAYVDGPAKISVVENGPVRVAIKVERQAQDSTFSQVISLSAGTAGGRVEFSDTIDWRSQNCNLKAQFPLAAANPEATYNWEVGTIERANNDPKKYEVPTHQWFDLTDKSGGFGAMVLCPFKYGTDKPADNLLRLTLLRTPGVYSDDYADQATQDWGHHVISYGLAGHAGDWRTGNGYWQAYRLEQPLLAFQAGKHGGEGREFSLLSVSDPGVRVLACKRAEGADELVVRLVELDGQDKPGVALTLAGQPVAARELNGQEQEIGPATLAGSKLVADFGPYQLRTFAIKFEKPTGTLIPCAPVTLPYNNAAATHDKEAADGGFDARGFALPAEQLPYELTDAGVRFEFAPAGGGQANAVSCQGQELALPQGAYNRIYFIMASSGEPEAEFKVDGQVTKIKVQDWGGYIGQWDNRVWKVDYPKMAFVWPYELKEITPGFIKRAPVAWFSSHRHEPCGQNDVYQYAYLYRYSIDLPAGAAKLVLPNNPEVKLLAASVAQVPDTALVAAQPLYDTLQGSQAITEFPQVGRQPKEQE